MTIRWQIGPYGAESWRALNISIGLMRKLEPLAEFYVTFQSPRIFGEQFSFVNYHYQPPHFGVLGRYYPPLYGTDHEIWLDNDHIMWGLPDGWKRFSKRSDACLIWKSNWDYYGTYKETIRSISGIGWNANGGMFGLPPGTAFEFKPEYIRDPNDVGQEEMGWIVSKLAAFPEHEYISQAEVAVYNPTHPTLGPQLTKFGSCGVHFIGMNRGFQDVSKHLDYIEKTYLSHT